jgi:hypothetical protein
MFIDLPSWVLPVGDAGTAFFDLELSNRDRTFAAINLD